MEARCRASGAIYLSKIDKKCLRPPREVVGCGRVWIRAKQMKRKLSENICRCVEER